MPIYDISISLSLYIYIYLSLYIYIYLSLYIYIYIYIYTRCTAATRDHMAAWQATLGLRVPFFWGATCHGVIIPVVLAQFHLVGMTTLWREAVSFAYPIIWHTAIWYHATDARTFAVGLHLHLHLRLHLHLQPASSSTSASTSASAAAYTHAVAEACAYALPGALRPPLCILRRSFVYPHRCALAGGQF